MENLLALADVRTSDSYLLRFGRHPASYFVPPEQLTRKAQSFVFSSAFCVPSGMERLSASTSLATVEKIGPSSEASDASQSCAAGV